MGNQKLRFSRWVIALAIFLLAGAVSFGQTSTRVQVLKSGSATVTSVPAADTGKRQSGTRSGFHRRRFGHRLERGVGDQPFDRDSYR